MKNEKVPYTHHVLRWWMGTRCKQAIHDKTEDVMSSRNSCNFVCPTDKDFRGTMLAPPNCASVVIHCSPPAMASLVSTISTQDDPTTEQKKRQKERERASQQQKQEPGDRKKKKTCNKIYTTSRLNNNKW